MDEIISLAKRATSSTNAQPWYVHVVTGEPLNRIREEVSQMAISGSETVRDYQRKEGYEGVYRDRQIEIAAKLFKKMGIERADKQKRIEWTLRGFRQFDAPVSIVLSYDKLMEPAAVSQFDIGAMAYGICLAAWDKGLGTIVNGQGVMYSNVVRKHAQIPDDQNIMICIAMGYPDDTFPANEVVSPRVPNEDFVKYVGFNNNK